MDLFVYWQDYLMGNYADRTSNFNYSKLGMLKTIKYPTGGTSTFEYEPHQVRVDNIEDILQNPFLKWSSNSLPTHTVVVAEKNTLYGGSTSGSFTLTKSTVVYMTAFVENDPSYLASARLEFSGPETGSLRLNHMVIANCNRNYCQGFGNIVLPAGTYTYNLVMGRDYDRGMDLHCNFQITRQEYDLSGGVPPFEAGGARIKKITNYDPFNGQTTTKKYVYSDHLSQVVFRNIPYYISRREVGIGAPAGAGGVSTYCIPCQNYYQIASESLRPFAGSNIEYRNVTEFEDVDGLGGKTEYDFMTSSDEGGNIYSPPFVAPLNTNWRAGALLSKRIYKYADGRYSVVKDVNNGYYNGTGKDNLINGLRIDYERTCPTGSPAERIHRTSLVTFLPSLFSSMPRSAGNITAVSISTASNISAQSAKHTMPTLVEKSDSKKQSLKEKTIYSFDYNLQFPSGSADAEALAIQRIVAKNMLLPIETIQIKTIDNVEYVTGATVYTYKPDRPVVSRIYSLKINSPVPYSSFVQSSITGAGQFVKDPRYEERIVVAAYDEFNNVTEQYKAGDVKTSFIWDYGKYHPVAEVKNAASGSVAYTSFEADGSGNWYIPNPSRGTNGITGTKCYQLFNGPVSKTGMDAAREYVVSYWSKGGACSVTGTVGSPVQGKVAVINGVSWTFFQHKVTGVTDVTVSGSADIDELRLHPAEAQMTTYTYEPLIGMTSQCDARNAVSYYQYDGFKRLSVIRDQDGNIIKTYDYNYYK